MTASDAEIPRRRSSLKRSLLGWFLVLAVAPLTFVSCGSYLQARGELIEAARRELAESLESRSKFFHNWIDYRFSDVRIQAESRRNLAFFKQLNDALEQSGQTPAEFTRSDTWARIVDTQRQDLDALARTYDYMSDLFLIDLKGNILFAVARGDDLGINLFDNVSSDTPLSRSARTTLETGETRLSDIEVHESSDGCPSAFLTAPMVDESGELIGLLTMQLRLERIVNLLAHSLSGREAARTYLVGRDGRLRTVLLSDGESDLLKRRIDTEPVRNWLASLDHGNGQQPEEKLTTSDYIGPLGDQVIGLNRDIRRPGIEWLMIGEIDRAEALAKANQLGLIVLLLSAVTVLLAVVLASYQADRIAGPLLELTEYTQRFARGEESGELSVTSLDETGELIDSFNQMVAARRQHEADLQKSIHVAQVAELALTTKVDDLARVNQELDSFAYIASHDLKEPLRGIHNYAHTILEEYAEGLGEEGLRLLETLPVLSQRLDSLLDALLRYATTGRKEIQFSSVSLQEVVLEEIDMLRDLIEAADVEVRVVDELPVLECDLSVARNVFRELITNALKYNDKPDRWIEIGVVRSADIPELFEDAEIPVFFVRDNGIGIAEKHLRTIFRIFKRLHVRDRFGSGSGAGLTVIEKMLNRCGGRIWAESVRGQGSTFYFTLTEEPDA